jgi:hypothetical protein
MRFGRVDSLLYVALGVMGFALSLAPPVPLLDEGALGVVVVNPWHSAFHVILGVGWFLAARTSASSKIASLGVGVVTGVVAILGYCNVLGGIGVGGIASPDNFIHLCTSILAFYYGTAGAESTKTLALANGPEHDLGALWDFAEVPADRSYVRSDVNPWMFD